MLSSWAFVKKKEKAILYCQGKKSKPFFLNDLCHLLCPKNKKNSSENFLFKKKVLLLLVYDKKKKSQWKSKALCRKFSLTLLCKWQNSAHLVFCLLPKTESTCLWKEKHARFGFVFFRVLFSSPKWRKVQSFFSFCQDNNLVMQDNKTFFCFTIVQKKQASALV